MSACPAEFCSGLVALHGGVANPSPTTLLYLCDIMSYIRPSSRRKYSKGEPVLYIYPSNEEIIWCAGDPYNDEDLCEFICRLLERTSVDVDDELVKEIRKEMYLDELE